MINIISWIVGIIVAEIFYILMIKSERKWKKEWFSVKIMTFFVIGGIGIFITEGIFCLFHHFSEIVGFIVREAQIILEIFLVIFGIVTLFVLNYYIAKYLHTKKQTK